MTAEPLDTECAICGAPGYHETTDPNGIDLGEPDHEYTPRRVTAYSHYPELLDDGTLVVNNSSLGYMASCEAKAHLHSFHLTTREESIKMFAGTCAHEAFAVFFRGEGFEAALDRFKAVYKDWADAHVDPNSDWYQAYTWENLHEILCVWFSRYDVSNLKMRVTQNANLVCTLIPSLVEIPAQFPLSDDGIVFKARIDAGVEDPSGHIRVVDHKTTGKLDSAFIDDFRTDSQFSSYVWAFQEHLKTVAGNKTRVLGGLVNAVQFAPLPSDLERKCGVHKVPYGECRTWGHVKSELFPVERTEEQIEAWKRAALRLARRYRDMLYRYPELKDIPSVAMTGSFARQCRFCFAKEFCAGGRPVDTVLSVFEVADA